MRILTVLAIAALLAGQAAAGEKKKTAAKDVWRSKTFTSEELKIYNGRDGMPVYAAVDGIVYDLSRSKYWKAGRHMKMHDAGADLSFDIKEKAPKGIHKGGKILEKMPKVGVLLDVAPVASQAPAPSAAQPRKPGKDELGKAAVCPVTGDKFKVNEETLSAEYKGQVYYFCCPACDKPFRETPEKYLGKKEEAAQAKAKAI